MSHSLIRTGLSAALLSAIGYAVPALAESISLENAMERAAQTSHNARALKSAVLEAEARVLQGKRAAGPRLYLDATLAGVSSSTNDLVGKNIGGQYVPNSIQTASLTVTQPIVALGPTFLRLKSELLAEETAKRDHEQSLRNAKYSAGEVFLRARKAEEILRISEASISVATKQRADGQALLKVGKIKSADLLKLDLAVSDAQTQRSQAAAIRDVSFFILAETLEIADWRSLSLQNGKDAEKRVEPSSQTEIHAVELAENNRSELAAMQSKVRSAELAREALRFDYLPQLNAFVRWDHDFAKKDVDTPPFHAHNPSTGALAASAPSHHYDNKNIDDNLMYGLSLKWNLWDWGIRQARDAESFERISILQENLAQLRQNIRIETMQAHRDHQAAQESLVSAQLTLKFAEELYRQTHARFLFGMATATDLVAAERDQTRARAGLSNAQSELEISHLRLRKATGNDSF
jgi:outer membrane protein TolC